VNQDKNEPSVEISHFTMDLSASFSLALTNMVIGRVDDGGLSVLIVSLFSTTVIDSID
jgi:hypothetical protein